MQANNDIRPLFPYLKQNLIYFDSAATSLKPLEVIDAQSRYYRELSLNIGRGTSLHNYKTTEIIEAVRNRIAKYIGAEESAEIIFTTNTTDSINMVAQSYVQKNINKNSNIVITQLEHHSNYAPWIELAKYMNIECRIVPLKKYSLDTQGFSSLIDKNTIITAVTGMSNVTGEKIYLEPIISLCRKNGSKILVDAAQLITHDIINVGKLDIDFLVFSAHKIFGPFGLGILYGKKELLESFTPNKYGGNMVSYINNKTDIHYKDLPTRLEAGTQNPAALLAFDSVLDFLQKHPISDNEVILKDLGDYLIKKLKDIEDITIYSTNGGIISFNINGIHPHDASDFFDNKNIILRTGNLCSSPFFTDLEQSGVIRVSLGIFNNREEIDILIKTVKEIKEFFL